MYVITIEDYQVLITWNLDPEGLMRKRDCGRGFFWKSCIRLRIPLNDPVGGILNKMNQALAASDEVQLCQIL